MQLLCDEHSNNLVRVQKPRLQLSVCTQYCMSWPLMQMNVCLHKSQVAMNEQLLLGTCWYNIERGLSFMAINARKRTHTCTNAYDYSLH